VILYKTVVPPTTHTGETHESDFFCHHRLPVLRLRMGSARHHRYHQRNDVPVGRTQLWSHWRCHGCDDHLFGGSRCHRRSVLADPVRHRQAGDCAYKLE